MKNSLRYGYIRNTLDDSGNYRFHDIDEHKKGQLSQSVFYQRWSAELTSIPPDKIEPYLDKINNFYNFIGEHPFLRKKSDSFKRYRSFT